MKNKAALRTRVERLIGGDFRVIDLMNLFVELRPSVRGKENRFSAFYDVANFIAHGDQRDRGVITIKLKNHFQKLQLTIPLIAGKSRERTTSHELEAALRASLELTKDEELQAELGLDRHQANSLLGKLIKKTDGLDGNTLRKTGQLNNKEERLFVLMTGKIRTYWVYDEKILLSQFCQVLLQNGLLSEQEERALDDLSIPLALFAIEKMHQSVVTLEGARVAELTAGYSDHDGVISVFGCLPITYPDGSETIFAVPVFTSSASPATSCDLEIARTTGTYNFECGLELKDDRKLYRL